MVVAYDGNTLNAAELEAIGALTDGKTYFAPAGKYTPIVATYESYKYANGNADDSSAVPLHDASSGAIPSYTTAKRGTFCMVSVAGTLGGVAVEKQALLFANQDNPTTAAHWDIVQDCAAEWEAAVAAGERLCMYGTFLMVDADPSKFLDIEGDFTILNRCGYTGVYTQTYRTNIIADAYVAQVAAVEKKAGKMPITGDAMNLVTRLKLTTPGDSVNYFQGQMVKVVCNTATPGTAAASQKSYIADTLRVRQVVAGDAGAGENANDRYIELEKVSIHHTALAAAGTVYVVSISEDYASRIRGMKLASAPTIIGESAGWWKTLFGTAVSGTVTASSTYTRTISRTAHGLEVNRFIRLGSTSDTHTSWKVTSVTDANTFVVTCPDTSEPYKDIGSAVAHGLPTTGTIYYQPVFLCSETNTDHHGAAFLLAGAPGSDIQYEYFKPWSKGLVLQHSTYSDVEGTGRGEEINPGTNFDYNITNFRLPYALEEDTSCGVVSTMRGVFPRHARTGSYSATASAFSATATYLITLTGQSNNYLCDVREVRSALGSDGHENEFGGTIISLNYFGTAAPYEPSYLPSPGNMRGSHETRNVDAVGGFRGLVLRNVERQRVNSVERVYIKHRDIPYNTTSQAGFTAESHSTRTNTPYVIGEMDFQNCGVGARLDDATKLHLSQYVHKDVGKAGIYVIGTTDCTATFMDYGFGTNSEGQTTRYANYMTDAGALRAAVQNITLGASDNPAAIFNDASANTTVKKARIGVLNISDPSAVGRPAIIESGRGIYFDVNIGSILDLDRPGITLASVTGLSVVNVGNIYQKYTVLRLDSVAVTVTYNASGGYAGLKLFDFASVGIFRDGVHFDLDSIAGSANVNATSAFGLGLGTTQQTTANGGVLGSSSNVYNFLGAAADNITLSAGAAANLDLFGSGSGSPLDGIGTPRALYLNIAGLDHTDTSNATLTISGTITIAWHGI